MSSSSHHTVLSTPHAGAHSYRPCRLGLLLAAWLVFPAAARTSEVVVPAEEATAQLTGLIDTLKAQRSEASARYYDGATYLRQLFQQAAVDARAMRYAASWGDNIIFLNWHSAQDFYDAHLEALGSSLRLVRNGRPTTSDELDTLAAGVRGWLGVEALIDADLERSARTYAQQARKLGEFMVLGEQVRALASGPERQAGDRQLTQLAGDANALRDQAAGAARAAIQRSRQRLFIALEARTADCETIERRDIVDTDAAFAALERDLRAALENADGRP